MSKERVVKDMFGNVLNVGDYVISPSSLDGMRFSQIDMIDFSEENSIRCCSADIKTGKHMFTKFCDVVFSPKWAAKNVAKVMSKRNDATTDKK